MPREITIVTHDGPTFDVRVGDRYADRLCWGEMLEQIAELTHPSIQRESYRMATAQEWQEDEQRRAARMAKYSTEELDK